MGHNLLSKLGKSQRYSHLIESGVFDSPQLEDVWIPRRIQDSDFGLELS